MPALSSFLRNEHAWIGLLRRRYFAARSIGRNRDATRLRCPPLPPSCSSVFFSTGSYSEKGHALRPDASVRISIPAR
jgi:hypothetical protein